MLRSRLVLLVGREAVWPSPSAGERLAEMSFQVFSVFLYDFSKACPYASISQSVKGE